MQRVYLRSQHSLLCLGNLAKGLLKWTKARTGCAIGPDFQLVDGLGLKRAKLLLNNFKPCVRNLEYADLQVVEPANITVRFWFGFNSFVYRSGPVPVQSYMRNIG